MTNHDYTPTPITVWATPTPDQVTAGVRYVLMAVSSIASTLGYTGIAGKASALTAAAGTIATVIVFIWGQFVTRKSAKDKAALATMLPDRLATTK